MSTDNESVERRLEDALAELTATTTFQDDAWDRITRRQSRRIWARWLGGGAIAVAAAAAIAFAFVIRIEDPSRVATTAPTPTTTPSSEGCPLTAEEVSTAIGETVTRVGSPDCEFGPGGHNSVLREASYHDQPASACSQESLRKGGYLDALSAKVGGIRVHGLGVDAYAQRSSLGMTVLVCNGDHPFTVHATADGDGLAAAVRLAKLVLNG
jgi:hypothetical protein